MNEFIICIERIFYMDYYKTEEQKNLMDYVGKTLVGNMDELY